MLLETPAQVQTEKCSHSSPPAFEEGQSSLSPSCPIPLQVSLYQLGKEAGGAWGGNSRNPRVGCVCKEG